MKKDKEMNRITGGFTMIELVAVTAILAILLSIAVPQMISYTRAAKRAAALTEAQVVADAVQRYLYDEKDKGTLGVKTIWKLMNTDWNKRDNVIKDYITGGQINARIVSISADTSTGRLKSLEYKTKNFIITIAIDEDGNRILTEKIVD